jgi:hypothetical protein
VSVRARPPVPAESLQINVKLRGAKESPGANAGAVYCNRTATRQQEDPLEGREEVLGQLVEEKANEGRTVWASFNWVKQVDLDMALEQQERLTEIIDDRQLVVKTAALEEAIEEWSSAELWRAQSLHSATILATESGLSLSRATPMPPS